MNNEVRMNYKDAELSAWPIRMDGKAASVITESLLEDDMPEESVQQTMSNAAEVLGYCPNPHSGDSCRETGIVIGKVQSGKTSNFISLTALAFDNGYNVIVVLGGTKKILVQQNRNRIEQYFKKMANEDLAILDTVDNKDLINSETIEQMVGTGKKVIIVALKNKTQINYIRDHVFNNSYLGEQATLIIDDEGDEASLNGLVNKNKKTATYTAIESLKNSLEKHCFVSVTATPQANILIDAIDILSPDFGILVNPGDGYCGLDVFHSDSQYIRPITEETDLSGKGIPESFLQALAHFFVACAINKSRGIAGSKKLSMLIHESPLVKTHKTEHEKINSIINQWRSSSRNKRDVAYTGDLKRVLYSAYEDYKKAGVHSPTFNEIEDDIINAINSCHVHVVNGQNAANGNDKFFDYNIYIGGALLGRGLTIKGLVVTYMSRTTKGKATVDTLEQRARWFGYKRNILDLCRIYMVPKLESEFMDIRDHEEDLWNTVKEAQLQGTKFKNIKRIFSLSDNLRPTRTSVAQVETFKFTHWNKQRYFQDEPAYANSNISILNAFKNEIAAELETLSFGAGAPYNIYHSDFRTIKKQVLDKFVFPAEEPKLNRQILDRLLWAADKYDLEPEMDLIWMRDADGSTSDHDIKDGNRIPNYSVGRRPKEKEKPEIYAGDDYQFRREGVMQLQIHNIRDKKRDIVSPTLALYVPQDIIDRITNLIYRA
jgi:hypothetical protein